MVAPLSRKLWWAPGELLAANSSANQRPARPRLPHRSFLIFFRGDDVVIVRAITPAIKPRRT